jgi:hypothetical protein
MAAPPPKPRIRVAGVPEHFNQPFVHAQQRGAFKPFADFCWTPVPGGTGAMVAAVTAGEVDVAVALTEGIFAAVVASWGSAVPLRYAGGFVASPLRWLVVTAPEGALRGLADVAARVAAAGGAEGCIRVAVSRLGSGSHLMAFLLALREGWPLSALSFHVHKDFRTMRRGACGGARGAWGRAGGGLRRRRRAHFLLTHPPPPSRKRTLARALPPIHPSPRSRVRGHRRFLHVGNVYDKALCGLWRAAAAGAH